MAVDKGTHKRAYKEEIDFNGSVIPFSIVINENIEEEVEIGEHWHDWYQILYLLDGHATLSIADETSQLKKDDLVILSRGDIHSFATNPLLKTSYIVIMFHPSLLEQVGTQIFESKYIHTFLDSFKSLIYSVDEGNLYYTPLRQLIFALYREYDQKEVGHELYIKGYIYQLIAVFMRCDLFSVTYKKNTTLKKVDDLLKYIEENYKDNLDLKQISKLLNLSYSYCSKYFKEVTGKTFKSYLDFVRISEAEKLILLLDYTVTEAAYEVGYSSVSSFNRTFKRVKGYVPSRLKSIKNDK